MMTKQIKSKERVKDKGEVFTNEREVNSMLDLVKSETERIDSRFLEPACGSGNFLIEILRRKLVVVTNRYKRNQTDWERYAVVAYSSCYGVDILEDNCEECRERLFKFFQSEYKKIFKKTYREKVCDVIKFILDKNIICISGSTLWANCFISHQIIFTESGAYLVFKIPLPALACYGVDSLSALCTICTISVQRFPTTNA